uniref:Translation initiation factor eIF2B subunit beta n=1 Tax=Haptolina brevifila TaxID=156173 RepID=A0A7S2J3J9_9EUKA
MAKLRRRQLQNSQDVARKTLEIMRLLVGSHPGDVRTLIQLIKRAGASMVAAQPHEVVIGNMVRRVLATVREEMADNGRKARSSDDSAAVTPRAEGSNSADEGPGAPHRSGPSLMKLLDAPDAQDLRQSAKALRAPIIEGIQEVLDELASVSTHIADQAIEYIHANEVILTHGRDPNVEAFLKAAHKKRTFDVIVAETAPSGDGHQLAVALAEAGISTTLIADAAVFAMMARVNKVIVGAHAVMANGGLIATAGCHLLALAAQHASVPLVACAGLYKLTPLFPSGTESFNMLLSPQPMIRYDEGLAGVHVPNPAYDYVPPELVSLLITNSGPSHASYIYRLLAEYYHQEDYVLEETPSSTD